jgi:hypothetical protein
VVLVGLNSTRWIIQSVYPPGAAVNSTGLVLS